MEDIDGGLHPAVDGQSLDDEDEEYVATSAECQLHTETEKTVLWYGDMWQHLLSASSTQKQRKQFYGMVICGNIC